MTAHTHPFSERINRNKFYNQWHGHSIEDLRKFLKITLQRRREKPIIYLAGDSSLDNKHWVPFPGPRGQPLPVEVPHIYHQTLNPPLPKPDVAFWINHELDQRATCINAAIEETMLRQRDHRLLPQDAFIRDNIRSNDILIVSIGGNDIALLPTPKTILHLLPLAWLTRHASIENGSAYSLPYFRHLFGTKVQDYVSRLTSKTKPRAVIISMIYFPLEAAAGQESWADKHLAALGYNKYPTQLQAGIRQMYESATKQIRIEGTQVLPCALYEALDGKGADNYTARVEPSVEGGRKIAEKFVEILRGIV